ncbi:DNA-binding protein c1d [Dispira parvispora]|uniref:Exosome complex protein n=1 Tax=Dispira parvispora TaxID=1520584 RepID=A0A9W8AVX1_9FUNG|nr:DNA-binding protein c1d [Dispira parvispora]
MAEINLNSTVAEITHTVDTIHTLIKPLLAMPLTEALSKLSPEERAQMDVLIAYSINTLYWAYLKLNGVPPQEHPVLKELQRIKLYIQKVKEATSSPEPPAADEKAVEQFLQKTKGELDASKPATPAKSKGKRKSKKRKADSSA